MTDSDNTLLDRITDESRRSFLKKSAVATAGVGAGIASSGAASAQNGDDEDFLGQEWKALTFANSFYPEARFVFVSGVVEWTPNFGDVQDSWFSDYNTRIIKWLNNGQQDQLFVAEDAEIGEYDQDLGFIPDQDDDDQGQPQVFEIRPEWSPFGDNQRLITVNFSPAQEETEDQVLDTENWWQDQKDAFTTDGNGGGGNATGGGTNTTGN